MLTVGTASLLPSEISEVRRALAPALTFTRRYHAGPYSLATLPVEVGATVTPFVERELSLPAYLLSLPGSPAVFVNARLTDTPLGPLAVLHECCHALLGHETIMCGGKLAGRVERDVWLASALVAVSRQLAGLIVAGRADVAEIAERCRVPEPLVMVRMGLMHVLGERRGHLQPALDTIRYWLRRLDVWISDQRSVTAWRRTA